MDIEKNFIFAATVLATLPVEQRTRAGLLLYWTMQKYRYNEAQPRARICIALGDQGMSEGAARRNPGERKRFGRFVIKSKIITFARYGLGQG